MPHAQARRRRLARLSTCGTATELSARRLVCACSTPANRAIRARPRPPSPPTPPGSVTTAFNGGFASVRSLPWGGWAALANAAGVRLLVRGDGRTYKLNLKVGPLLACCGRLPPLLACCGPSHA